MNDRWRTRWRVSRKFDLHILRQVRKMNEMEEWFSRHKDEYEDAKHDYKCVWKPECYVPRMQGRVLYEDN